MPFLCDYGLELLTLVDFKIVGYKTATNTLYEYSFNTYFFKLTHYNSIIALLWSGNLTHHFCTSTVNVLSYIHTHAPTHTYTPVRTCTHTNTHTHTYTYTHTPTHTRTTHHHSVRGNIIASIVTQSYNSI